MKGLPVSETPDNKRRRAQILRLTFLLSLNIPALSHLPAMYDKTINKLDLLLQGTRRLIDILQEHQNDLRINRKIDVYNYIEKEAQITALKEQMVQTCERLDSLNTIAEAQCKKITAELINDIQWLNERSRFPDQQNRAE